MLVPQRWAGRDGVKTSGGHKGGPQRGRQLLVRIRIQNPRAKVSEVVRAKGAARGPDPREAREEGGVD